jgi:hypothetical protein
MSAALVRVRFLTSIASEREAFLPGQVADLDRRRARSLIASGAAVETEEPVGGSLPVRPACCRTCGASDGLALHGSVPAFWCSVGQHFA